MLFRSVTLPLVSFGGTSLMSTFFMIGIYLNMRSEILKDVELIAVEKKVNENFVSKKIIPFKKTLKD